MDGIVAVPPVAMSSAAIAGVTIFLFEGKKFSEKSSEGKKDVFCEFQLGEEKYRTRKASGTDVDQTNPLWMEEFDLFLHETGRLQLEVVVWESRLTGTKGAEVGRTTLDLTNLEFGKTEELWLDILNGDDVAGSLHLSFVLGKRWLTMDTLSEEKLIAPRKYFHEKFHPKNTLKLTSDENIGILFVKILKGKNILQQLHIQHRNSFCCVELINSRLDTPILRETSEPEWNSVFTFPVQDVHSDLIVSIFHVEENSKNSVENDFVGFTKIRLTETENNQKRWFRLKDKHLSKEVGGSVLLETELIYNPIRAAVRSIALKEPCYNHKEAGISLKTFSYDVQRARNLIAPLSDMAITIRLILNWESPVFTILSFIFYVLFVTFVEIWMFPCCLLICMLANHRIRHNSKTEVAVLNQQIDDFGEKNDTKNTTGIFTKVFVEIPDTALHIQNILRFVVDLYERFLNILQFNEKWLATFLVVFLSVLTIFTFFIPFRLLLILFGVHKFTKKLRQPNSIPHNDVLAFLSRGRTNDELRECGEVEAGSVLLESHSDSGSDATSRGRNSSTRHLQHGLPQRRASRNLIGVAKLPKF